MKPAKLLDRILAGAVTNVELEDLVRMLRALGFEQTAGRGSHRVFTRLGVAEFINLQDSDGQAKPYQVRQVAAVVRQYNLDLEGER